MVVCGTRVDEEDFYSLLLERVERGHWHSVVIPATDNEGRSTWPERYTPEFFAGVRAEMNNDSLFNLVYQQVAAPEGSALFDWPLLDASKMVGVGLREPLENSVTIAALDPSQAGPYAAMTISYNRETSRVRVLDVLAGNEGGAGAMQDAVRWCLAQRPTTLAVERQGGHALFIDDALKAEIESVATLHLVETTAQGMVDAEYGFGALRHWFAIGRVEMPWYDTAQRTISPLLDEMAAFRRSEPTYDGSKARAYRGRKDRLMALWFCFRMVLGDAFTPPQPQFGAARNNAPWLRSRQRLRYLGV